MVLRRNPESPHNVTYACTTFLYEKRGSRPHDWLRIIDRDSVFLRSASNNPRNGSLYIMKKGSLPAIGKQRVIHLHFVFIFNLCSKRNILNAIHFSCISAGRIVNEDDRSPRCFRGCLFSNKRQELPEGGLHWTHNRCVTHISRRDPEPV